MQQALPCRHSGHHLLDRRVAATHHGGPQDQVERQGRHVEGVTPPLPQGRREITAAHQQPLCQEHQARQHHGRLLAQQANEVQPGGDRHGSPSSALGLHLLLAAPPRRP